MTDQPDAAPGETPLREAVQAIIGQGYWHHGAEPPIRKDGVNEFYCIPKPLYERLKALVGQPPAPPSAPASTTDAGAARKEARQFEKWWREVRAERDVAYRVWTAQRQHAAEVERLHRRIEQMGYVNFPNASEAALEAAQQEGAKLRYELAFAAPQFHGKGEQMEGRWHCRVCGVFGQGYDTIKHRDTCPLYGYDYTTARSTLAATPPAAPPAEQEGPAYRLVARIERPPLTLPEDDCHAMGHDQPPPAARPRRRERVLADWADCPHCHHWGHQHRYGVCMVCDKRDQTCGLFALTPPPANADALPQRVVTEEIAALESLVIGMLHADEDAWEQAKAYADALMAHPTGDGPGVLAGDGTGDPLPPFDPAHPGRLHAAPAIAPAVDHAVQALLDAQQERIDALARAFTQETGLAPSDCVLNVQTEGTTTRFWITRRPGAEATT